VGALDCGNHTCQAVCHAGACAPCALTPQRVRTCPCGRAPVESLAPPRASCLDPVPCCGAVCSRVLSCGHRCAATCHLGACPPCAVPTRRSCRYAVCARLAVSVFYLFVLGRALTSSMCSCGSEQRDVPCSATEALCRRECNALRECGRHRCNTICCPQLGLPHACPLTCGKPLKCGTHKYASLLFLSRAWLLTEGTLFVGAWSRVTRAAARPACLPSSRCWPAAAARRRWSHRSRAAHSRRRVCTRALFRRHAGTRRTTHVTLTTSARRAPCWCRACATAVCRPRNASFVFYSVQLLTYLGSFAVSRSRGAAQRSLRRHACLLR
jgi:hypothetical protein